MADKWINAKLGEYIDSCLGKMLDKQKNRGDFHPYLGNKNVRWGSFDLDDLAEMRFEKHEHERYGLEYGDLIVCEGGEPGRCAIWRDQVPGMKIQKALHRVRTKPGLNNVYLYYWFMYAGRYGLLEPYFTGTTIKHLTGKSLSELDISIPPLSHQEKVAYLLGGLDEKIELNRQMNETLEQMAQALFKSWFVDFDPVIDNALGAGNPIPEELEARAEKRRQLRDAVARGEASVLGMPDEIRSLFPSEFELTDEMGWIPEGWSTKPVYDMADFINGAAYKKFEPNDSKIGLPIIKIAELKAGIAENTKFSNVDMPKKYLISDEDILFSWSGNPDTSIDTFVWGRGAAWLNQHIFKVVPLDVEHRSFLLSLLRFLKPTFSSIARDKQTTGLGHVTVKDLKKLMVVVPDSNVIAMLSAQLDPLFKKSFLLNKQDQQLRETSKRLLPKLISGELQIPDAEQQIAEALS